jgi:transcriptional antiterminator RfaH
MLCSGDAVKEWYVLRSKPKREHLAGALLGRAGVEVYVPEARTQKAPSKPPVLEPFFPSYFFARLDPTAGEIRMANYTSGVLHVVGYGGQPTPIPETVIERIRERLAVSHLALVPSYRAGEPVKITAGPMRDLDAVFDSHLSAGGRVRVLVTMIERLCPVELPVGQLRRVDRPVRLAA